MIYSWNVFEEINSLHYLKDFLNENPWRKFAIQLARTSQDLLENLKELAHLNHLQQRALLANSLKKIYS